MIQWTGLGFLVPVLMFGSLLVGQLAIDSWLGKGYYTSHDWPVFAALLLGGVTTTVVSLLIKKAGDQVWLDEETGRHVVVNNSSHTFFFVPMLWWGIVVSFFAASWIGILLLKPHLPVQIDSGQVPAIPDPTLMDSREDHAVPPNVLPRKQ